jgi:hypothetical protein
MSITSRLTVFPGSKDSDELSLESPSLGGHTINTPALLSVDGSHSTTRSVSALGTKDETHGQWVVALNDSRGPSGEVGIAAISTLNQETIILELADTARFTRTS